MKTAVIILAAGKGSRFGTNKLLAFLKHKRIIDYAIEAALFSMADKVIVVCSPEVEKYLSSDRRIVKLLNNEAESGMSRSIQIGISFVKEEYEAVIISSADQPLIAPSLYNSLIREAERNRGLPVCAAAGGDPRNPALFPSEYFDVLMDITGDIGGRKILRKAERIIKVEVDGRMLLDIDSAEDLAQIESAIDS